LGVSRGAEDRGGPPPCQRELRIRQCGKGSIQRGPGERPALAEQLPERPFAPGAPLNSSPCLSDRRDLSASGAERSLADRSKGAHFIFIVAVDVGIEAEDGAVGIVRLTRIELVVQEFPAIVAVEVLAR